MGRNLKKKRIFVLAAAFGAGIAILTYLQIATNSWHVHSTSHFLRAYAFNHLTQPNQSVLLDLEDQLTARVELYYSEIRKNHLDGGMVINRETQGTHRDKCDSLLFSSLLYTALIKLGKKREAHQIWHSIEDAVGLGAFIRHPDCASKATSRDQILGLLVAMSQRPEGYQDTLQLLFQQLSDNNGYFSHGGPSVSYMTPGLADIFRRFARLEDLPYDIMPGSIRRSFSTMEVSVRFEKRGYRTHLSALQVWLELELGERHVRFPQARSILSSGSSVFKPFLPRSLDSLRTEYLTQTLVERQPQNLFYRYLRYRSANAFNQAIRAKMMSELLTMRQFPATRLPSNCDRKADYMWQRGRDGYKPAKNECTVIFSGVDFLWMAALLLEPDENSQTAAISP